MPTSTNPYPLSAIQQQDGVNPSSARVLPRPPLTTRLGDEWSYGQQVPTCRSYAVNPDDPADFTTPGPVPDADLDSDDQTVVWRDGTLTVYRASSARSTRC